mmetsp:Transcript_6238/g.14751  ORF Transcript_6238/g.14751 Transcript_6238/m.14751 type:complete len:86 (+) Transcript_6238:2640-2897(+)
MRSRVHDHGRSHAVACIVGPELPTISMSKGVNWSCGVFAWHFVALDGSRKWTHPSILQLLRACGDSDFSLGLLLRPRKIESHFQC